jgi:hypothetical protein
MRAGALGAVRRARGLLLQQPHEAAQLGALFGDCAQQPGELRVALGWTLRGRLRRRRRGVCLARRAAICTSRREWRLWRGGALRSARRGLACLCELQLHLRQLFLQRADPLRQCRCARKRRPTQVSADARDARDTRVTPSGAAAPSACAHSTGQSTSAGPTRPRARALTRLAASAAAHGHPHGVRWRAAGSERRGAVSDAAAQQAGSAGLLPRRYTNCRASRSSRIGSRVRNGSPSWRTSGGECRGRASRTRRLTCAADSTHCKSSA